MGLRGVVIGNPGRDQLTRVIQAEEQALVQQLVPHAAIERLAIAILHRLARGDVVPLNPVLGTQARMAFEVNSVPLSETIIPGLPRRAINGVSSRATRLPEIEVSGIAARHSRVTSSTMFRIRKRRPLANWS